MVTLVLIAIAAVLAAVLLNVVRRNAEAPARVRVENINIPLRRRTRR
jgi:hypothetical protein